MGKHNKTKEELQQEAKAIENQKILDAENKRLRTLAREKLIPMLKDFGPPKEVEHLLQWITVLAQQSHMTMLRQTNLSGLPILQGLPEDHDDVPKLKAIYDLLSEENVATALNLLADTQKEISQARERKAPNTWEEIDIEILDDPTT